MSTKQALADVALGLSLLETSTLQAAPTRCSEQFANGQAPDLLNPKLAPRTHELCFTGFAVDHSGLTRTPLWSAEPWASGWPTAATSELPRKNTS